MINEALFPVKEVPAVGQLFGKGLKEKTGYKFIVREDNGDILSCMTDEYQLVTNQQLYDASIDTLRKVGAVEREVKVLADGKRSIMRYVIPNVKVKVSKEDVVNPEIMLKNSYDGSWEIGIQAGAYRLVCSNGMVIGVVLSKKSNKHSIYNPRISELPELIAETIETTANVFKDDFALMLDTKVNKEHVQKLIEMIPTNVMEPFVQYLMSHNPDNYWDLINAATWVNTHHMNRGYNSTHKFESQIFPTISKWTNEEARA
jgi:hypothetical protein